MNIRNRRLVCILLAFVVTLAGMSFDTIRTDVEYGKEADTEKSSFIHSTDSFSTDVRLCTSETLGMRCNEGVRQTYTRSDCHKRDVNRYHGLLSIDWFSICEIKAYTCPEMVKCCDDSEGGIVTEYIHRSDGKKRI